MIELWAAVLDWTTATAAKGFGATVTGTGFQLALQTLWPSHVTSTRSQAAPWAWVAMRLWASSPWHGCR